jgi:hypothetical protein
MDTKLHMMASGAEIYILIKHTNDAAVVISGVDVVLQTLLWCFQMLCGWPAAPVH